MNFAKTLVTIAIAATMAGCGATRPEGGGLTESEFIVITALVRSGAAAGADQVKNAHDANLVADACRTVGEVLEGGDFTTGVDALQERIVLSAGQIRAVLNLLMALRGLIPTEALESQYVDIFTAGTEECVLVLEAKFPEIKPTIAERALRAIGLGE